MGLGREMRYLNCAIFGLIMASSSAYAQDLVYEPINPSFGGNAFNSAHLLAIANAQNDYEQAVDDTGSSDLDRFVRSLQSRLLSSLSGQVADAIFGEDAQERGTIIFGDQTISFERTLDGIQLTITDGDGNTTVITIPTLLVDDPSKFSGELDQTSATSKIANLNVSGTQSLLAPSSLAEPDLGSPTLAVTTSDQPIQ